MVSSYTTNKNLEKPGNGDYVDTWNVPLNSDMNVIDAAFGGVTNLNATGGSAVLNTAQYQNLTLNITGAISGSVTYTIPSGVGGSWIVRNTTTDAVGGPWSIIVNSGGGGTSVTCIRGKAINIYSDGTNIREVQENVSTLGTVTSVNVSGGTTGLTTSGGPVTSSGTITIAGTLGTANGGTNLTGFTAANNALYSTSASALTAGTLPIAAGGTGVTTFGTGVQTALGQNVTGTGGIVLSSGAVVDLTNATGLPLTTGVTGTLPITNGGTGITSFGTGVQTALGQNVTGSGSFVLSSGATFGGTFTGTASGIFSGRYNPRVSSTASASSVTPDLGSYDQYCFTALAAGLTVNAPIGTPLNGNKLIFRLLDNGVSQTLTWNAIYNVIGTTLPTATTAGKSTYIGCIYNSDTTKWDVVAVATQA